MSLSEQSRYDIVVYVSQGYTIGLGDQLIKVIKQLK